MESWANGLRHAYEGAVVNKGIVNQESMLAGLPLFVSEWLARKYLETNASQAEGRKQLGDFIARYLPQADQKEQVKSQLIRQGQYTILDEFEVTADLKQNRHRLRVRKLDIHDGYIPEQLLDTYPRLLSGGVWGAGTLEYDQQRRTVTLVKFVPLMVANFRLEDYVARRAEFSVEDWIAVLISSQGLNPDAYPTTEQRLWLIARMLPLVEPNLNLVELAPKGTGKTHLYKNLSYYARVISGGTVTPAVLFYSNERPPVPGLLATNDVVVFDEVQSIDFPNADETVGILKDYMNSGSFTRGRQAVKAGAGVVLLGNIPLDAYQQPVNDFHFSVLPTPMQESAFLDRIHGFIPGWKLPKVGGSSTSLSYADGLCADYLSEALHSLRDDSSHSRAVDERVTVTGTDSRRDELAVKRIATGMVKLLFPHLKLNDFELNEYALEPALKMRQIVRDQLHICDKEYRTVQLTANIR